LKSRGPEVSGGGWNGDGISVLVELGEELGRENVTSLGGEQSF